MKSKYLIIIFMIILIFLGILWLKYNSSNKEGIDEANASAMSGRIMSNISSEFSSAGIDLDSYADQLPAALDQINQVIENEAKDIDAESAGTVQGPPDYSTAVDTTGSDYYPSKNFFTGARFSDGFCKTNSNPVELNTACSTLTAENCNLTDCCVLLQGNKCVAGDASGPINQVDEKGEDIDYAYYSYKNQCYGSCGKGIANASNPCSAFSITDAGINERCIKRLWAQAGCPNGAHINPGVVDSLKNYSKAAIQVKFKNARKDEPNYEKCYGPNESRWPVPCNETTDASTHLSARCLTKLFTDVGCTNKDTITSAYATANELKEKSEMINIFTDLSTAEDDSEGKLTQCYGPDESQWPDPCIGVPDTANLLSGTMPVRCAGKIFKEVTKCTSEDYVGWIKYYVANSSEEQKNSFFSNSTLMSQWSKAGIADTFAQFGDSFKQNRYQCHGMNPNKWPDDLRINKITPDPCASLRVDTKTSDVPVACSNRLKGSDIFPTTNCSKGNAELINNYVSTFIDDKNADNLMGFSLINSEMYYNIYMDIKCKPDPPASGRLYGKWIKDNKESIPVVAAKYLNDGNTVVYLAPEGEYVKMATDTGVAKFYKGSVNDFDSVNWGTYSDAGDNYKYSQ
jgi:hypothetical protein